MSEHKDYYKILELEKGASANEIKSSYRRLARKFHPYVNPDDPNAEERFKQINEAYQVLSDPKKKENYDRFGTPEPGFGGGGGFGDFGGGGFNVNFENFDLGDIFGGGLGDIFGGMGGGRRHADPNRPMRGNDMRCDVTITLEEAAKGTEKKIRYSRMETCSVCHGTGAKPGTDVKTCPDCNGTGQIRRQQQTIFGMQMTVGPCPKCNGTGKIIETPCAECGGRKRVRKTVTKTVTIPAGMDTDMQVRVTGAADAGLNGGPAGDLYARINVRRHPRFVRQGNDLICDMEISFPCAALGGNVNVETFDGPVPLNIAAGTQYGEIYTLKGKGMPNPADPKTVGNLNVRIKIKTPTDLKDKEKKLLEDFAQSRGEEIKPHKGKNIFKRVKDAFK